MTDSEIWERFRILQEELKQLIKEREENENK